MSTKQVHTDVALVKQLLTQFPQFSEWHDVEIESITSNHSAFALYKLGDDFVVQLPLTSEAETQIVKAYWDGSKGIMCENLPQVLGAPAEGYEFQWTVYSV